jgi:hypothetical protein
VFFEICINDERRKKFWLRYSKKITAFKVFGPAHIGRRLRSDERISAYVNARFFKVGSSVDVSAFMFQMANHKMIEFSDPGYAFYAYLNTNRDAPSFNPSKVSNVDSLRNSNMPMLLYRNGYYMHKFAYEGRLGHKDGDMVWEQVFAHWLNKIAGVYV